MPPRAPTSPPADGAIRRTIARILLGTAVLAMAALHALQPELDPWREPVSFYAHGAHGWLLPLALGTFGATAWLLGWRSADGAARVGLLIFAASLLLTAAVPSDPFFPWEARPSVAGLVHAAAAVFGPPLLGLPMWRQGGGGLRPVFAIAYGVGLLGSGLSLLSGFLQDASPPWIGVAERGLAVAAVGWLAMMTKPARPGREAREP